MARRNRRAQTLRIKDNRIFIIDVSVDGYIVNGAVTDHYYRRINGMTEQPYTGPADVLREMARKARGL